MTETTRDNETGSGASALAYIAVVVLVALFVGAMLAHLALRLVELAWRVT